MYIYNGMGRRYILWYGWDGEEVLFQMSITFSLYTIDHQTGVCSVDGSRRC